MQTSAGMTFEGLPFEGYGDGIGSAATVLRANATSSGLTAPVPTCPGWSVADLVRHQGIVHRWAAGLLSGEEPDARVHEAAAESVTNLLDWFDEGATDLLDVLSKTREDWDGWFFLRSDRSPRDGWARRQCHETTIHAVDAMAARLGRTPMADEVWFSPRLAADGIDELVMSFAPRRSSGLRSDEPVTIELTAADTGDRWSVEVGAERATAVRGAADSAVDVRWTGPARDLYLLVWNRLGQRDGSGASRIQIEHLTDAGATARGLWQKAMKVVWS
ncbi:MAG: maleylpyruvate isomerase family mycothiol-dependent enzyme [Intrasporangiaceae bacterium]|nr:maleylpyruvate isomerase family mycothiol-dependent enzyme [Intrasporangiaceae bacterium]